MKEITDVTIYFPNGDEHEYKNVTSVITDDPKVTFYNGKTLIRSTLPYFIETKREGA